MSRTRMRMLARIGLGTTCLGLYVSGILLPITATGALVAFAFIVLLTVLTAANLTGYSELNAIRGVWLNSTFSIMVASFAGIISVGGAPLALGGSLSIAALVCTAFAIKSLGSIFEPVG